MLGEGNTRCAVADADIAKSPLDLSDRVGTPIHRNNFHLVGRKSLSDSVSATSVVMGQEVPMALFVPESIETLNLGWTPLISGIDQILGNLLGAFWGLR